MPELPEVQTTVNGIKKYTKNLAIKDVWTSYNSAYHYGKDDIKDPKYFSKFKKVVIGAKIKDAERRGKNVLIHLNNGKTILVHMKMTGHFLYGTYRRISNSKFLISKKNKNSSKFKIKNEKLGEWEAENGPLRDDPFNRHIRLLFSLSNGKSLALCDSRKFAKTTLIDTNSLIHSEHIKHHGPEPLDADFTVSKFKERLLMKPNWPIKKTLMDLTVVSGIGNIYSDEILWVTGIHPEEKVKNISDKSFLIMFKAMKNLLFRGIDFGGDSMSDYRNILGERGKFQNKHEVYQRKGEKCRKKGCKGEIKRIVVASRGAHFCDTHQKLKKV